MARKLKESKLVKMSVRDLEKVLMDLENKRAEVMDRVYALNHEMEVVVGILSQNGDSVTISLKHYSDMGIRPFGQVA